MMENLSNTRLQRNVWVVSLILAPLLLAAAQFYWNNGLVTSTAGWLQVLAFTFWIPAFHGMFSLLRPKMPKYAVVGFLIAIYACIGGNNFGIDGVYMEAFGINSLDEAQSMHDGFGLAKIITLYLPGALFPISILVLGICLLFTRTVPTWLGILLIIAAIGFPVSRIPREPIYAHIDNFFLLLSHMAVAWRIRKN